MVELVREMKGTRDRVAGLAVFILTLAVFLACPVRQVADPRYSILLSERLLYHGSFALDPRAFAGIARQSGAGWHGIYQLELVEGRVYYYFPPGSSILSLPYVALMNAAGISATHVDGTYDLRGEKLVQASLAAVLMAAFSSLVFFSSRLLLSPGWSLSIALGVAFGTQVLSTTSRGLWSDTWAIVLLGLVVYLLLAAESGHVRLPVVALATLVAWGYFVRPTNSVAVVAVTAWVILFHRSVLVRYLLAGAAWLVAFVFYSLSQFGQLLPNYYLADRLDFRSFWWALLGNLVSPSRGLLTFVPITLFVVYLAARYASDLPSPRLAALCAFVMVAHLIVTSGFSPWWGGHCYGPRFTAGLVPWLVLLTILALAARLSWRAREQVGRSWRWRIEIAVGSALLLTSVAINARGAADSATARWNITPVNVDEHPERLWDWEHPQFLASGPFG
jgi:hypothetical protein